MIYFRNSPLAIAAHLAGSIEELAAMPRPTFSAMTLEPRAARLPLTGVLDPDYLMDWRRELYSMAASEAVSRIVVLADSPGGLTLGTPETAEAVRRVVKQKPVEIIAHNFLASGAYWIASQASSITVTPSCYVGSCGVMMVLLDDSAAAAMAGVRVLVVASGPAKGAGVPGTPVEPEHLASVRRLVDHSTAMFMADVERGRGFKSKQTEAVFTGDVWHGATAKTLGLVDRVALLEDRLADFSVPTPRTVDLYGNLVGVAAVAKFDELIAAAGGDQRDLTTWNQIGDRIAEQYPALAAAVDAASA